MKKKILSTLLTLCLCLSLLPTAALAEDTQLPDTGDTPTYRDADGNLQTFTESSYNTLNPYVSWLETYSFYVLSGTLLSPVQVRPNANLVLYDDQTLSITSLTSYYENCTLNIYAGASGVGTVNDIKGNGTCSISSITGLTVILYGGTYTSLPTGGWKLGEGYCFRTGSEGSYTYSATYTSGTTATVVKCSGNHTWASNHISCDTCGATCPHATLNADAECDVCGTAVKVQLSVNGITYGGESLSALMNKVNTDAESFSSNIFTLFADVSETSPLILTHHMKIELGGHTLDATLNIQANQLCLTNDASSTGGTVTGKITISDSGDAVLGENMTLQNGIETTVTGKTLRSYLATTSCFGTPKEGGGYSFVDSNVTSISGSVVTFRHNVDSHEYAAPDGKCSLCGEQAAASYTINDTTNYRTNASDALRNDLESGAVVKLLKDASLMYSGGNNISFTLDLNGHEVKADSTPFTIGSGVTMTLQDTSTNSTGKFNSTLQLDEGSKLTLETANMPQGTLKVNGGALSSPLTKGTFGTIAVTGEGQTVGSLLADGYGFKGSSAWYDSDSKETSLSNVSVEKLPITGVSIDATKNTASYGYSDTALPLSASPTGIATGATVSYQWYCGTAQNTLYTSDNTFGSNSASAAFPTGKSIGTYYVGCTATVDGCTVQSQPVTITVNRATLDSGTYTAPTGKTNLTYNGEAQSLVNAGTGLPTDVVVKYRLGTNGTWMNSASDITAKDVETYSVYWYIDGGANYENVGSENAPKGTLDVSISALDISNAIINLEPSPTYNGSTQSVTIDSVKVGNLTLTPSDYDITRGDSAANVENKELDIAGKGNFAGTATKTWSLQKAAPTAENFTFVAPTSLIYDGSAKTATVEAKSGVTGMGNITVKYFKGGTEVTEAKDAGTYTVKINVAEGNNYSTASDLTDNAWTFVISKAYQTITVPENQTITKGITNVDISAWASVVGISGGSNPGALTYELEGTTPNGVTLTDNKLTVADTVAENTEIYILVTAAATDNYSKATKLLTVTVKNLPAATVTTAPKAVSNTLTYNGQEQTLVTAGVAEGGTMQYRLGDSGTYSADIPKAKNADTYTVWYKVRGNNTTHIDSGEASVSVTIHKATPTGTPTYTAITESGKKLSDAALAIGTITPTGGTITWDLPSDTEVTANTAYNWTYTPASADQANYTTLTGSVTPYPVSSGGGGGSSGGGSSKPSAPSTGVTVPVTSDTASVEVKADVSKDGTAKVEVSDKQIEQVAADGSGTVTVDVSGVKNVESVQVPSHVVETTNQAEETGLTVTMPTGSVALDETALDSVSKGEDVTVSVQQVPATDLNEAQQAAVGDMANIGIVIDVDISVGGTKQSTFNGGKLTISVPYTPKKNEDVSKLTVWYIKDDGTIQPMGGSYDAEKKCFVFETTHLSRYVIVSVEDMPTFTDVPEDAYYADAVTWAVLNGITTGMTETTFGPDLSCTRAQIVTFLWRAAGEPEVANVENPFSDVTESDYFYQAVLWAVENKITTGTTETTFSPEDTCTRAQAAAFIYRNEQANGGGFTDNWAFQLPFTDVPDWCYEAVAWCYMNGVTQGTSETTFSPNLDCSRAQIVTMLYRVP